ncbi:hypothetical protein K501DRAFT_208707 [Backusella circina FSU 941]|nr:hypothetical protein K501DRAFT_208707 [Backusella circina FSU 941]
MNLFILLNLLAFAISVIASNVKYSVIAFPKSGERVIVTVDNNDYILKRSEHDSVFTGSAPSGSSYRYSIVSNEGKKSEKTARHLSPDATATGNEFFDRSRTVFNVPDIPKAYDPIYPALKDGMGVSNEIATLIVKANQSSLDDIFENPKIKHPFATVFTMTYVNSKSVHVFKGAGIKNSGQSSKEYAKQSFKFKLNEFNKGSKELLFNRQVFKLRAQANDASVVREKLLMDMLSAAGAVTFYGHFVRLYINDKPYGLFLMTDDTFEGFTDNLMNGGNPREEAGATFKGNAVNDKVEANLVYKGDDESSYSPDAYSLEDKGKDTTVSKTSFMGPLIQFMKKLKSIDSKDANGIMSLMDSDRHTMVQLAMSFLTGSWDGAWYQASNFYLTQSLKTGKWTLITYDFDETFGNGLEVPSLMTTPYTKYFKPNSRRPLVDAFIKSSYYKPKFEEILFHLVERFFNPQAIKPVLNAWEIMLKEDVAWDRRLAPPSEGDKENWGVEEFQTNLYSKTGDTVGVLEWIKNRSASLRS